MTMSISHIETKLREMRNEAQRISAGLWGKDAEGVQRRIDALAHIGQILDGVIGREIPPPPDEFPSWVAALLANFRSRCAADVRVRDMFDESHVADYAEREIERLQERLNEPCQVCAERIASHAAIEAAIERRTEDEGAQRLAAEYRFANLENPSDDVPF